MIIISKIYEKLLIAYKHLFNKNQTTNINVQTADTASVLFKAIDNDQIAVILNIPSITTDYNTDNIVYDAENYANFLVHITNGLIYDQVLSIVKKKRDETKDINNKLFLNNVLYFFSIIENDLEQAVITKVNSNKPLIRPLSVFNVTPT